MTSTPISIAARLLHECAEEIKSTCTTAGEWCSQAADDKAAYEERIAAANLLEAIPRQCLLQIQEPPTKTEALAHYSQQAILAMGEAAHAAVAATAPVVLPEPVAAQSRFTVTPSDTWDSCSVEHARSFGGTGYEVRYLYTEQQLRSLLAGVSAPAAQAVPEFCHVAQRKLQNLMERGYTVTGYALEKTVDGAQPDRGFINHGGFVGWWWDGQTLQAQADARDVDGLYYLQDARWSAMVGNCPSFWRLGGGYTTSLDDAERFTLEAAIKQHKCRETDLPWLCSELDKLRRPTIDCQDMPRSWDAQRAVIGAQAAQQTQGSEHV